MVVAVLLCLKGGWINVPGANGGANGVGCGAGGARIRIQVEQFFDFGNVAANLTVTQNKGEKKVLSDFIPYISL